MDRAIQQLCAAVLALSSALACAQTRRALILGIDTYQPQGTSAVHPPGCTYGRCSLPSFANLHGAVNDARAMAELLTSSKFGFPARDVVLLTNPTAKPARAGIIALPASQTTREGILAAMHHYLVDLSKPGDTVVFYDASHGSLRVDPHGEKLTVRLPDGKLAPVASTLVPSDAYKGGYDILDREMTAIFNAALDKGVHLTVIFDSCHSGGATRGLGGGRERTLPYDPRPVVYTDGASVLPSAPQQKPTERPSNPALVFAAAQQDQTAKEAEPSASVPETHGAFTAALLQTLQVLPADAPASLVYQRVKVVLEGQGTIGQEPDLDATPERRSQPLFGGPVASESGKVRTAALKTAPDGRVWLDIGTVSGIGPGSEFRSLRTAAGGKPIVLRIAAALGITRSAAAIVSPAHAAVPMGEVFELSKLVPASESPLYLSIPPSTLTQQQVDAAVSEVAASGIPTIADPAEEPYTDILAWSNLHWTLRHLPGDPVVDLGQTLSAKGLTALLLPTSRLWVDLPPSSEMAAELISRDGESNVKRGALEQSQYVLAGSIAGGKPVYAWFHKDEFALGSPSGSAPSHSPGCSATSAYPVRSDWAPAGDLTTATQAAAELNAAALRLAKVHGWLHLANSSSGGSSFANYYHLALLRSDTDQPLSSDDVVHPGQRLKLALAADGPVNDPRWVYVLDIDCHGAGTLLYPRNYSENQYPSAGNADRRIILRHAAGLNVGPPYGIDTLILLSTSQPLTDPSALNFEGVTTRGLGGHSQSPGALERLLQDTSRGTRGLTEEVEIPTDWGIDTLVLHSVPQ